MPAEVTMFLRSARVCRACRVSVCVRWLDAYPVDVVHARTRQEIDDDLLRGVRRDEVTQLRQLLIALDRHVPIREPVSDWHVSR